MQINLVLLTDKNAPDLPVWPMGQVFSSQPDAPGLIDLLGLQLPGCGAVAWLFWDASIDLPSSTVLEAALEGPGDIWHAGLLLGMRAMPGVIDFVSPTWMLNCDPSPELESTSWRVSLRACLVRAAVLQQLGFLRLDFAALEAAALEWGHRCVKRGAVMRHLPALLPGTFHEPAHRARLSFADQLRFVRSRFGRKWTFWACLRAVISGYAPKDEIARASLALRGFQERPEPPPYISKGGRPVQLAAGKAAGAGVAHVSVIVPTLERYPYLKMLLGQLRSQTCQPAEVIVIDQTPAGQRPPGFFEEFKDLPLKLINLAQPGQCSSRNAGLQAASGEYILFLDDDDEILPDLIAAHLAHLLQGRAAVSSGVVNEVGAGPIPQDFRLRRVSDVFPTNNSLIERSILARSGLFDLAYDRGQRADGDLGMRIYLSGALMLLAPEIQVLHHHAPRGGLRAHKARTNTFAESRRKIFQRHLPSVSDCYLGKRYFSSRQTSEARWLAVFGTFIGSGPIVRRLLKGVYAALLLPHTLWTIQSRNRQAQAMLKHFPKIPELGGYPE